MINVSKFLGLLGQNFGNLHMDVMNEFLDHVYINISVECRSSVGRYVDRYLGQAWVYKIHMFQIKVYLQLTSQNTLLTSQQKENVIAILFAY